VAVASGLVIPLAAIAASLWAWRTGRASGLAAGYAIATGATGLAFATFFALLRLPILLR
jgi:hypothetical protein